MKKLTIKRVQEIIREEISSIKKDNDHDVIANIVNTSVDLLKSIEKFNEKATEAQKAAVMSSIEDIKTHLLSMRDSAPSYVTVKQTGPKKVTFKKVSDDENLSD